MNDRRAFYLFFRNEFKTFNSTRVLVQMFYYLSDDIKLHKNCILGVKTSRFCHFFFAQL